MAVLERLRRVGLPPEAFLIGKESVAQLVCLVVVHSLFSVASGVAIYLHLSLTDLIKSLQACGIPKTEDPSSPARQLTLIQDDMSLDGIAGPRDVVSEKSAAPGSVMDWGQRLCAACSRRQPDTFLIPCGHSVLCGECAQILLRIPGFQCPLCCADVVDSLRSPHLLLETTH